MIKGLFPGVTTFQLDELAAEQCASMTTIHPDYATLAARIGVDNLHKETKKSFSEVMKELRFMTNDDGRPVPMISDFHWRIIEKNADRLNSAIIYDRDFNYQYFGFKTLMRSYLLKDNNGKVGSNYPRRFLIFGMNTCDIAALFLFLLLLALPLSLLLLALLL